MRKQKWLRRDRKLSRRRNGMRIDRRPNDIIQSIIKRSNKLPGGS